MKSVSGAEPGSQKFVENLEFRGLSFQRSQWLTPVSGRNPSRAASDVGAAVMVDGARNIVISHYDFRLKANSPATQIGFVPFDASKAGVYGDGAWIKLAARRGPTP
jgi:hypothetical protein